MFCPNLEELNLSGCKSITDVKAIAINLHELRTLSLSNCAHLENPSVIELSALPHLKVLYIDGCPHLSDETFESFGSGFSSLNTLRVGRNKVSSARISKLRTQRPNLVILETGGDLSLASRHLPIPSIVAQRRLQQDLAQIENEPLPTINAAPVSPSNLFVWHANLFGIEGTHYAGGIFHMMLEFPSDYPNSPPTVTMLTPLPHPHVINNRICIDILGDFREYFDQTERSSFSGWSSAYTVQSILIQLQSFLLTTEDSDKLPASFEDLQDAIDNSRKFKCPSCKHGPLSHVWPKLPILTPQYMLTPAQKKVCPDAEMWRCYYTGETWKDKDAIIGFGWNIQSFLNKRDDPDNPGMRFRRLEIRPFLEPLSMKAFDYGVHKSILGDPLTHFMPLYINRTHGSRIRDVLLRRIAMIDPGTPDARVTAISALKVVTYMMNSTIVAWFKKDANSATASAPDRNVPTLYASENAIMGYCACHRLLLYLLDLFPDMREIANARIERFIKDPKFRTKDFVPDLGCFVQSICISDYRWKKLRDSVINECFIRSVAHKIKINPELKVQELNPDIDDRRFENHFESMSIGLRLMLFQVAFLEQFGKPSSKTIAAVKEDYDSHNGIIPPKACDRLMKNIQKIRAMKNFTDFYRLLGVPSPSPIDLQLKLIDAVKASFNAGYHY